MKDSISYKRDTSKKLNNFLYEYKRQFNIKDFQKKENRENITSTDRKGVVSVGHSRFQLFFNFF